MKIILTATSPSIEADVDGRFGRGAHFLVVDPETLAWQAHTNPGLSASGGAGIQAAQFATDQKAEAVLSGDFGPNGVKEIEVVFSELGVDPIGQIPFDPTVTRAMLLGQPVNAYKSAASASLAISLFWWKVISRMNMELKS